MLRDVKQLLHTAAYLPIEIERLLTMRSFLEFDPELGYIQVDYVFKDGLDETSSVYTYELHGRARKMINYADRPCRVNTYGNSYTQCAQVSDGETWQEILAAYFREPIRNFGVGGYGVYQAYRRAMRMEPTDLAAEYIILNIWDEDHLRNIDAARWIRVAWTHQDLPRGGAGEDTYPVHGFPWAHVRYDLNKREFVELPGLCEKAEELRKLVGTDAYYETFKDDTVVHLFTLREGGEAPVDELEKLAEALRVKVNLRDPRTRMEHAKKLHLTYGLRSTEYIIEKLQRWAQAQNRKLMILLSYDAPQVRDFIVKGERFDQELVEYLQDRKFNYADCLMKAAEDYKAYNLSVDEYLERFYVARAGAQVFGHYNPYGNFWFAFAIRKELVGWLDPVPPAYR